MTTLIFFMFFIGVFVILPLSRTFPGLNRWYWGTFAVIFVLTLVFPVIPVAIALAKVHI